MRNKKALLIAAVLVMSYMMPAMASATALTQAGIRLGRLGNGASAGNDLFVSFKLNTTPTSVAKIRIAFPAGFTIATGTPTPTSPPSGYTIPPGTLTSAATAGSRDIIVSGLTSASLSSSTLYGFVIPSGTITNPSTEGQYIATVESQNSGGTTIDTTSVATYIYGSSANQDQVTVTASVAPLFTFTLSGNSDTVPQADKNTVVTSSGITLTIGTNAPLGYTAYVKSANAALNSASTSGTIPTGTYNASPDSVVAGTSSYTFVPSSGSVCVGGCNGSSTITYDGEYNAIDSSHGGSFNSAGSFASFVSRNGYTGTDNFTLKERVAVSAIQAAATDYADTLTIVAAGNY